VEEGGVAGHPTWRLTEADAEEAGALLARAFVDEPIFVAALPDRAERARLCPPLFALNVRYARRFGEAWAAGAEPGAMRGGLCWVAMPEAAMTPELAQELGFDAVVRDWGGALDRVEALEEQAMAAITDLPARWRYLPVVGVEPAWQGRGLGSALLRQAVAAAAAAATPLCLVTDRPQTLPLYRRAGFELVADGAAAEGAVPWWALRTPVPSQAPGQRLVAR
jgi:GNAT superfamily N-acetyltransferase